MAGALQRSKVLFRVANFSSVLPQGVTCASQTSLKKISRSYGDSPREQKPSFFQRLWDMGDISLPTDAHSKTLAAKNSATYELQFECVKPGFMNEYLGASSAMNTQLSDNEQYPGQLVGSWTTMVGDLDEAVHLWVYEEGYKGASDQMKYLKSNKEVQEYHIAKGHWLRSRRNQLLHEFSYWGKPKPRKPSHVYEMRSYNLKPGTLIEWGNKWGNAIKIRRKDAVGGFFSQVGDLYQVHHMWAYNDLEHRKLERERMWQDPGWDDCVAATVPLVRQMQARILHPTSNSPLQ